MRLPHIFAVVTICLLPALSPEAGHAANRAGLTGAELLQSCNSTYDTDYGFCAGYVSAIANALLAGAVAGERACSHGPVRSQQLIDIFRAYAEIFPETLPGPAAKTVAVAIGRAFPCP